MLMGLQLCFTMLQPTIGSRDGAQSVAEPSSTFGTPVQLFVVSESQQDFLLFSKNINRMVRPRECDMK